MSLFSFHTGRLEKNSESPTSKEEPKVEEKIESHTHYIWLKGESKPLNEYFRTSEFTCKCSHDSCKEQKISIDLIDKLTNVRKEINTSLIITSGFRCSKHQSDLRKVGVNTVVAKKSTHEDGEAADVVPRGKSVDELEQIASKHFDSIGLAKNFLHLDTRSGYRRWKY
jgi:uncharacterized protein YcbK (DUF882 family)